MARGPASGAESSLSVRPPAESVRAKEFPKRGTPRPWSKRGRRRSPGAASAPPRPHRPRPLAARRPARGALRAAPSAPLTQAVRSGAAAAAAGAWERAAPAGVNCAAGSSQGRTGGAGNRLRRAEVGEGRRRARAPCRAPGGRREPRWRGRSAVRAGQGFGVAPLPGPGMLGPASSAIPDTARRPAGTRPATLLSDSPRSPRRNLRAGTRTSGSPAPPRPHCAGLALEGARAGRSGMAFKAGAAANHRPGEDSPLQPTVPGSGTIEAPPRLSQSARRGGRQDRAGRGWRRWAAAAPPDAGGEPSPPRDQEGAARRQRRWKVRRKANGPRGKGLPLSRCLWLRPGPEAPPGPKLCVHSHSPPPFHPAPTV